MNIGTNYTSCPKCKNIFLKNFFKIHYQQCNKKENEQFEIKKLMDRKEYERQQIILHEEERRKNQKKEEWKKNEDMKKEKKKYEEKKQDEQKKKDDEYLHFCSDYCLKNYFITEYILKKSRKGKND